MSRPSGSSGANNLTTLLKTMGGDDCDRPACDDTKSALSAALKRVDRRRTDGDALSLGYRRACPPTRDEIGAQTWSLLHSMAAWYPNKPTSEDELFMSTFMVSLARFYPCTYCASDFQRAIQTSPPRTETREDLCLWLCEQHNVVNEKLGKPLFDCTINNLDERWRKSSNTKCQSEDH